MLGRARRFSTAIFGTFSTFTFAFLTHTMAPQITAELRNPSRARLVSTRGAILPLCTVVCVPDAPCERGWGGEE